MKNNWKFTLSVVGIILSSALLLTGCMAAIAASSNTTRPYQLSTVPQTVPDTGGNSNAETVYQQPIVTPDLQEPPVSQEELKAKFSAMYDFSQGNASDRCLAQRLGKSC